MNNAQVKANFWSVFICMSPNPPALVDGTANMSARPVVARADDLLLVSTIPFVDRRRICASRRRFSPVESRAAWIILPCPDHQPVNLL
jgi:hypothetical protein